MKMFFIGVLIIVLGSCKSPLNTSKDAEIEKPIPAPEIILKAPGNVPTFTCLNCNFPERYFKAFSFIHRFANTDEFETYFLSHRKELSHVDGHSPEIVMKTFRKQLALSEKIEVSFYWQPLSSGIGAWDIDRIKENTKFNLSPISLAAHLLHETSHKYGWKHLGNFKTENNNQNSFPYAVGDEFEKYLTEKGL